jgi:hypothetical protein
VAVTVTVTVTLTLTLTLTGNRLALFLNRMKRLCRSIT